MTDPLAAYRNIDDPAPRDMTRAEVAAAQTHRALAAACLDAARTIEGLDDANDWLQLGVVTSPTEIAAALRDCAGTIEAERGRIERGAHGPEEAV